MMNIIKEYVNNIKTLMPDYWKATLTQRLVGGAGSCYEQFTTTEELETAILGCNWEETTHPNIMLPCIAFKAQLPGRFGMVRISNLPDDIELISLDPKNTGKVSVAAKGVLGEIVPESYLIVGEEQGKMVIFTFHPGEPLRPSEVETIVIKNGTVLTKEQAMDLGFDWAKIIK